MPPSTILRRQHAVTYIAEINPSIPDEIVLEEANRLGAMLITADPVRFTRHAREQCMERGAETSSTFRRTP